MRLNVNDEISGALHFDKPIVALESTVIAQGLPYPQNVETALRSEAIVRTYGAVPATIAIFGGQICVGISEAQIETLAKSETVRKVSRRDLPIVVARKLDGATTVAATLMIAHAAGIKVFATGGIGGVHRGHNNDISADLPELARTPLIVVCAGAKAVLDLAATREWLETSGITVLGWQCDEMPAFYSRSSGLSVDQRVESAEEVAAIAMARNDLGIKSALLVTVPVPEAAAIEPGEIEDLLAAANHAASERRISGKDVTPFLLSEMADKSGGQTLTANLALLEQNASVAARIAAALNY
jgi:pseudouridine-5'-phosphate glycosidase